jgi:hypothetical protein
MVATLYRTDGAFRPESLAFEARNTHSSRFHERAPDWQVGLTRLGTAVSRFIRTLDQLVRALPFNHR